MQGSSFQEPFLLQVVEAAGLRSEMREISDSGLQENLRVLCWGRDKMLL